MATQLESRITKLERHTRPEKVLVIAGLSRAQECQQLLTAIMRDPDESLRVRLKAAEMLGKAQGDFIIRRDVTTRTLDMMSEAELAEYKAALEERKRELLEAKARAEAEAAGLVTSDCQ